MPTLVLLPGLDGTGQLFAGPHLLLQTRPAECAAAVLEFMRAAA
jgi:hypothetical protein